MQKQWIRFLPITVLLICLGIGWMAYQITRPILLPDAGIVMVDVEPGMTLTSLANTLHREHRLSSPLLFRVLARLLHPGQLIQAGRYKLTKETSQFEFLSDLMTGNVQSYAFTIIEGWRFDELVKAVAKSDLLRHDLAGKSASEIMQAIGHAEGKPEGWFLPTTYHFHVPYSDVKLLKRAYQAMLNTLQEEWDDRENELPYKNAYQALIAASLIEMESANLADREHIAGVIVNRLHKRMRLQIDPTVRYALKQFDRPLQHRDMHVRSPFNTYVVYGLPPTPIALPSAQAIHAALNPKETDDLYFVAKGNGRHEFSATLKGHRKAVKEFLFD